jgi:hypothetical protein
MTLADTLAGATVVFLLFVCTISVSTLALLFNAWDSDKKTRRLINEMLMRVFWTRDADDDDGESSSSKTKKPPRKPLWIKEEIFETVAHDYYRIVNHARCSLYVMIVDKNKWNANKVEYGVEDSLTEVYRVGQVERALRTLCITDEKLFEARENGIGESEDDGSLSCRVTHVASGSAWLNDDEHSLVFFRSFEYSHVIFRLNTQTINGVGDRCKYFFRGKIQKNRFLAVFQISRDLLTGTFKLPLLSEVIDYMQVDGAHKINPAEEHESCVAVCGEVCAGYCQGAKRKKVDQ